MKNMSMEWLICLAVVVFVWPWVRSWFRSWYEPKIERKMKTFVENKNKK